MRHKPPPHIIYGVLVDGRHVTVSHTANGAKKYAAKHGHPIVAEYSERTGLVTRTWIKEGRTWVEEEL